MKTFIFPGQGSQSKGMGGELFDEFKELTKKVDKILGYSIKELCLEDPRRELNQTQFTQSALYVVNALSYFKKVEDSGQKPDYVAGHSLGEFNALLASECFSFESGLKLVKKRGELMSKATGGGMAAILNASKEEINKILEENRLTNIDLANYNTPSQIVISGLKDEIAQAQSFFQEGEMKYIVLNTSGAFHSRHMEPSRKEFETYINKFKFSNLKIPVISNVTALPYQNDEVIKNLSLQITSSVKWSESIQYLIGLGEQKAEGLSSDPMEFEEIGHGKVLTKQVNKILEETPKSLEEIVDDTQDSEAEVSPSESDFQDPNENNKNEEAEPLTADVKVGEWNKNYPTGTKVKSMIVDDDNLETRTEAVILFGHRAAVYMKGYNGYFDLDEITPL